MAETRSIPVLLDDNTVAFDDAQDLGMVLVALCNDGTSWLFIAGADALRLQQTVKLNLGLRHVPRPVVSVECTPRYQSPGAVGCEVQFLETQEGRAALDGLLTVVAAVRDGGAPPSGSAGQSSRDLDSFDEGEATSPDPEPQGPEPAPEPAQEPQPEPRAPAPAQERKDLKARWYTTSQAYTASISSSGQRAGWMPLHPRQASPRNHGTSS